MLKIITLFNIGSLFNHAFPPIISRARTHHRREEREVEEESTY